MKDFRIVYMGTPEFAVPSLRALVHAGYKVAGVITAPDKPAGRGRKLQESAVKKYALATGLKLLQPTNLKDPDFLEELRSLRADLQVVVAFRMLPVQVWEQPKLGTFNLHASMLPDYRGAAPINWAIINGETRTGLTTFFINEDIDTGNIILQREVPIGDSTTAGELHDLMMEVGSDLVLDTVALIAAGEAKPRPQKTGAVKMAPKLNKENCRIRWDLPMQRIFDHIRGLSPYPAAWTQLYNKGEITEMKIYRSQMVYGSHDKEPGAVVVRDKQILVAVNSGYLKLLELQLAGKRKLDAISLLNGYRFEDGSKMI